MLRRLFFMGAACLILLACSSAQAAWWTDLSGTDHLWSTAANWNSSTPPTSAATADFLRASYPGRTDATLNSSGAACSTMKIKDGGLNVVSGGSLTVYSWVDVGGYVGAVNPGLGTMTISGTGSVTYGPTNTGRFFVGNYTDGLLTMQDSATLSLPKALFQLGSQYGGDAEFRLYGGTIDCNDFAIYTTDSARTNKMDVSGGTLNVRRDVVDRINGYYGSGRITAYGGRGTLNVSLAGGITTVTATVSLGTAWNPSPVGAAEESPSMYLTWKPGDYVGAVNKHDVYFGLTFDDVNAATTSTPVIYKGRQDPNIYGPLTGLKYNQTYYWRIDEVNEATSTIWKGPIWSFYLARTVDDMEAYLLNPIASTWVASAGSVAAQTTVGSYIHGGKVSMALTYPATVKRTFTTAQNWTAPKTMLLYFQGLETNTNGSISVQLADNDGTNSPTISYPDSNTIDSSNSGYFWNQWVVNLQDFNSVGMDMANIKSITISVTSGSGTVYIDDILLTGAGCYAGHKPAGDFTGDCTVDELDLQKLTSYWLDEGGTVTAEAPNDLRLQVRYAFEDSTTDGNTADSSGNGRHGQVKLYTGTTLIPWNDELRVSGGYDSNNCAYLWNGSSEYKYVIQPPNTVFASMSNEATFSFWVKLDDDLLPSPLTPTYGGQALAAYTDPCNMWSAGIYVPYSNGTRVQYSHGLHPGTGAADNVQYTTAVPNDWKGSWVHWAFVKNSATGLLAIYRDGVRIAYRYDAPNPATITRAYIGTPTGNYRGKIDEFRVYDYALSQEEIVYLANKSSVYQPMISSVDPFVDDKMNFKDFAALASIWADEVLWP